MIIVKDLPKLKSQEHSLEPLWGDDTGRNSNSGKYSGTFIGYFSQLVLEFGKTTQTEMTEIKTALQNPIIENVKYKDSDTGNDSTEDFYGTKIPAKLENLNGKYSAFSITLTAIKKRS